MSDERSQCRLAAMEMAQAADKHNYEGPWATVAVAASNLEIAAALWELATFLPWAFDQWMKRSNRGAERRT